MKWRGWQVFCVVAFTLVGCKSTLSPHNISDQAKGLGVYALIGSHLTEIQGFGVQTHVFIGGTDWTVFRFREPITKVSGNDISFVINIPNTEISGTEIYELADPKKSRWGMVNPDEQDPKPIKARIEPIEKGIYKVTPAVQTAVGHQRYVCLWLRMSMGTPDRLYAIDTAK